MRITSLLLLPFALTGCATLTPISGDYGASPFELLSSSCGMELDMDDEPFVVSVVVDPSSDTLAIEVGDGMAFSCELDDDVFDCNELTTMTSDDRADRVITYGWHLAGAFSSETSIAPLTFTFSASCEGEDCDSLVGQSDMTLPCEVVFQSSAEMK